MTNQVWVVDQAHSSIDFTIKHMMIAKVKGTFNQFEANISGDPHDLTTASIELSIDLSSIDTRNSDRDAHVRSADFFNVEVYPTLTFKATSITKTGDGEYEITGDVHLHGVTRSETFVAEFAGAGKDPWGNTKIGFGATGSLKRSDYGLTYNAVLETGGVLIGDEIKVSIEIEAVAAQ